MSTISRRQFLATTGAITGTALLNPLTGMKAEAANVMAPKASKKLRLAKRVKNCVLRWSGPAYVERRCGGGT